MNLERFSFDTNIIAAVKATGYTTRIPIQQQAIPIVLQGCDVVGLAQTGTGKTPAFVLPILQRLTKGPSRQVRALIVAPTRELAEQIHQVIADLGKNSRERSANRPRQRNWGAFINHSAATLAAKNHICSLSADQKERKECTMPSKRPFFVKQQKEQKRRARALEKREARRERKGDGGRFGREHFTSNSSRYFLGFHEGWIVSCFSLARSGLHSLNAAAAYLRLESIGPYWASRLLLRLK